MLAAALALGVATVGCRTTTDDVHRWANTAQGPRKLVAVMIHDKYERDLRVEAAMTLIRMRPRAGRRVGIDRLVDALNEMPEDTRNKLVAGMVPQLVDEIEKDPTGEGEERLDTATPYKDAAFALLTNERGSLISSEDENQAIRAALTRWATTDFATRSDDSSQKYGVEQVLRFLGAESVRSLPALIELDAPKIDRISRLIADLGEKKTKVAGSKRLVKVAKAVAAPSWKKAKAPKVKAANAASKLKPTKDQFAKQLEQYQEEELLRIFGSLKKVGQKPAVDFLLGFAADGKRPEKQRAAALAALEGHIDKKDAGQIERVLAIASADDTPDPVRDQALRRVGEMPRKAVVAKLYGLFKNDNWKIRWVAAELVLKMSDQSHLGEFMKKLGRAKGLALTEPLRYGALMGGLKGKQSPDALAEKYAQRRYPVPVRLSALGYYYDKGTKADLPKVAAYESDRARVPECEDDATDCEWQCTIGAGNAREVKEVETLGEYVEFCIKPAMQSRVKTAKKKKPEKKKP